MHGRLMLTLEQVVLSFLGVFSAFRALLKKIVHTEYTDRTENARKTFYAKIEEVVLCFLRVFSAFRAPLKKIVHTEYTDRTENARKTYANIGTSCSVLSRCIQCIPCAFKKNCSHRIHGSHRECTEDFLC